MHSSYAVLQQAGACSPPIGLPAGLDRLPAARCRHWQAGSPGCCWRGAPWCWCLVPCHRHRGRRQPELDRDRRSHRSSRPRRPSSPCSSGRRRSSAASAAAAAGVARPDPGRPGRGGPAGCSSCSGSDLGTAMILHGDRLSGSLFVAGAPLRIFAVLGARRRSRPSPPLVTTSENRMNRVDAGCPADETAERLRVRLAVDPRRVRAWRAAAGGGLGSGRAAGRSGCWLPEAHNDFIFAIIGEELGLPGTLSVLGLFGAARPRADAARRQHGRPRSSRSPPAGSCSGWSVRRSSTSAR